MPLSFQELSPQRPKMGTQLARLTPVPLRLQIVLCPQTITFLWSMHNQKILAIRWFKYHKELLQQYQEVDEIKYIQMPFCYSFSPYVYKNLKI